MKRQLSLALVIAFIFALLPVSLGSFSQPIVAQAACYRTSGSSSGGIASASFSVNAGDVVTVTTSGATVTISLFAPPSFVPGTNSLTWTATSSGPVSVTMFAMPSFTPPFTIPSYTYAISAGCSTATNPLADGRINPDAGATVVGYCNNGALNVWAMVKDKWYSAGTISKKKILDGLDKAISTGTNVLLFSKYGQQVWALSSNELQFHSATGTPYDAILPGNICG